VPVLVATAVLKLSPFRWITFVQDLRERDRRESVEDEEVAPKQDFEEIVGSSAALRRVQQQVEVVAPTDATVLILGETGTGKELVARAVHRLSPRRNMPFVTLNCAAIPTGLLESELFGYERGAFTGALQQKIGRFEMAHRGTLFLDEVGDIPLELQPKLLRALQEKAFERLGGTKTIPIDVRLVAATNRNLTQMMGEQAFSQRSVLPVEGIPDHHASAARPRRRHSAAGAALHQEVRGEDGSRDRQNPIGNHESPGKLAVARERTRAGEFHRAVRHSIARAKPARSLGGTARRRGRIHRRLDAGGSGADHILRVFRDANGVVSAAAARLGVPRTTLNAMMKKLGDLPQRSLVEQAIPYSETRIASRTCG